jgi:hypothetical protein
MDFSIKIERYQSFIADFKFYNIGCLRGALAPLITYVPPSLTREGVRG